MKAQTQAAQSAMTPDSALQTLKEGNSRFVSSNMTSRDLIDQVSDTSGGQFPFATVLGCIDSRVSAELIFDQGVGDIFSVRIAGNFVNKDILGSMEFATKLAGTKLIVVLGHTSCGAVKGACDNAELGNLTSMLEKIQPAVIATPEPVDPAQRNSSNAAFVNQVAIKNVELTINRILKDSPVIGELYESGEIDIVGAMYDVATGEVKFM